MVVLGRIQDRHKSCVFFLHVSSPFSPISSPVSASIRAFVVGRLSIRHRSLLKFASNGHGNRADLLPVAREWTFPAFLSRIPSRRLVPFNDRGELSAQHFFRELMSFSHVDIERGKFRFVLVFRLFPGASD